MDEYIERKAVLYVLDEAAKTWKPDMGISKAEYLRIRYKKLPAADVRPVVLCRDCKNNYNTCLNHGINEPMCDFTDRKLRGDDFCSRGVKREES